MASLISLGQIIDTSLGHYKKHYKELIAISMVLVLASLPSILAKLIELVKGSSENATAGDWLTFGLSFIGWVAVIIASLWTYATLILTIDGQAKNRTIKLKEAFKSGWQVLGKYTLLSIVLAGIFCLLALAIAPGTILIGVGGLGNMPTLATLGIPFFILGGIVAIVLIAKFAVELNFSPYVLLLDKEKVLDAVKSSRKLVQKRWLATVFRLLLPKLIYFVIMFIVNFIILSALGLLRTLFLDSLILSFLIDAVTLLAAVLIPALVTPLLITTDYYLYGSLRDTR
jgi:hypothetical protein